MSFGPVVDLATCILGVPCHSYVYEWARKEEAGKNDTWMDEWVDGSVSLELQMLILDILPFFSFDKKK